MPVIKKYLKNGEAPKALSKRSMPVLNRRCLEPVELDCPEPQGLQSFTSPIRVKLNEMMGKVERSEFHLKSIIDDLSDTRLEELHDLFSKSTRGTYTEDNIAIASKMFIQEITQVENGIIHLKELKNELVRGFLHAYSHSYFKMRTPSDVQFDNLTFISDLGKAIDYRKRLRDSVNRADAPEPAQDGSCTCM